MVSIDPAVRYRIALRVDSGTVLGAGHLVRCLALAHALHALGCEVHFITRDRPGHIGAMVEAAGFEVHLLPPAATPGAALDAGEEAWLGIDRVTDARQTRDLLDRLRPYWLVIDHYGIDARWQVLVAGMVSRVAVIDDLADRSHLASLLVDQNLQSRPGRYAGRVDAACLCLLGPRHALLRPEFVEQRRHGRQRDGRIARVLACVGGADPLDLLPRVILAWSALGPGRPALDVAVGADTPNLAALRDLQDRFGDLTLHTPADNMASLMDAADLLVCAAGSVNWERCCLRLPALVIQVADNQADNLRLLTRARTCLSLGYASTLDTSRLSALLRRLLTRPAFVRRLGERSARLVDGLGARRVASAMTCERMGVRPAELCDGELAWRWRNEESTRRYFTDPSPVPLEAHLRWWQHAVADTERSLLVVQLHTTPVGVVRLDHKADTAVLSIYLDPAMTGLGLGPHALEAARRWAARHQPRLQRLEAVIDARNHASQAVFRRSGYMERQGRWTRTVADA